MAESASAVRSLQSGSLLCCSQPINMSVSASMYLSNSVHSILVLTSATWHHGWRQHCILFQPLQPFSQLTASLLRITFDPKYASKAASAMFCCSFLHLWSIQLYKETKYLCKKSFGSGGEGIGEVHCTARSSRNRNQSGCFTEQCLFNSWRLSQWQVHPYLIIMKHKLDVFAWVRLPSGK